LEEVRKSGQFSGRRAVVHIPPRNVFTFPIHFQVGATETVEEAIVRETREHLSFPIEEAIIDYPSIVPLRSGDGDTHKAAVIAIHRDHLNRYLRVLKQAGLSVDAVDFGVSALLRLHNHLYEPLRNPAILCAVGHTQSLLSAVTEERILVQHDIPWGIEPLIEKILRNLTYFDSRTKAKTMVKQYGLLYEEQEKGDERAGFGENITADNISRALYQITAPYMEDLVNALHRIVGFVRAEEINGGIKGIYLYGQASFIRHLDRYLERRINIPTTVVNPLTAISLARKSILPDLAEGAPYALALGLAMRKVPWL
jgi:type IV pilus assembly protein PilM